MKRIISIGLSLIMLLVSAVNMALPVAADSGKIKEYVHDGYVVEYNIVNEWTGNQNVRVTVTNTGDEEICGCSFCVLNFLINGKLLKGQTHLMPHHISVSRFIRHAFVLKSEFCIIWNQALFAG